MKRLYEKLTTTRSVLSVLLLGIFLLAASVVQAQTVTTDEMDYAPGETVLITGTGFTGDVYVALTIFHPGLDPNHPHNTITWNEEVDENGNFSATWIVDDLELNTTLILSAQGLDANQVATANYDVTTFTDALKQDVYPKSFTSFTGDLSTVCQNTSAVQLTIKYLI